MTRIVCRTPSTGKPVFISSSTVSTTFSSIVDAPDFSVPDTSNRFDTRDPNDASRAIRPGEIFFLTPLAARNKDTETRWIEVRAVQEDGSIIEFGRAEVPAGDTALIPLQGRSIFKRDAQTSLGDSVEIRSETNSAFDVWMSGEEKLSNEHSGVVEE